MSKILLRIQEVPMDTSSSDDEAAGQASVSTDINGILRTDTLSSEDEQLSMSDEDGSEQHDPGELPSEDDMATQMDREGVEAELRAAGFGYRAKYVHGTAKALAARDPMWLQSLRAAPYAEAHRQLIELPGVGAKVADCVCLMALDKTEAVPIDVHVWRMATRHYLPHLKSLKNLSAVAYKEIGDHFRKRFGPYAGWAQSVLFTSDLKKHAKSSSSEPENLEDSVP
ncbi:hypothetical protein HPB51_009650 [Rhipicephalus microplus]|uniref:N-glycosylase/DNA lyase n=1 Tax=Rhipicephalus microplus TaxID=6941 RepID=A0A9J6D8Z3_RHIMP|nr:hypothetical protein HPB51_009650 [Rhipicephalus microplus]